MIAIIIIATMLIVAIFLTLFNAIDSMDNNKVYSSDLEDAIDTIIIRRGITGDSLKDAVRFNLQKAYKYENIKTYEELDNLARKISSKKEVEKWQNAINAKKKEL